MSQLQLSLLGEPVVKHGGQTVTFSTRKALALLVYLAVEGGIHTRKTLSEAFWPELDSEHGRAALRATLLELRKLLERSHEPGEHDHLQAEHGMLAFEQDSPFLLDLRLVEVACKQVGQRGEALSDQTRGVLLAQLEQATRLARGPFLAGFTLRDSQFFDDWTRQHREYWHLRMHQLFDALSMLYERAGDGTRAIETINRWLGFDPLHEEGYRRLMRLRYALGDRAGALRAYATCCTVLDAELQVEPAPETVALAKQIRLTAPVRSMPSHPSHSSNRQLPTNLLDGPFLGRATEFGTLIDCYQRVHAGQPYLVLLQGETGIGKTRLSSEFASWVQVQGADVLVGRALQTGRQLPYQPFIDILRHRLEQENAPDDLFSDVWLSELTRLLPELRDRYPDLPAPAVDEELGRHHLFEATARLIQKWAAHRPLLLLLDDMQWADTATLDLVLYLARRLADQATPVLLLLNLRTGGDPFSDLQSLWLMALKRTRIPLTSLLLSAFTYEGTRQFVQALAWAEQPCEGEGNCSVDEFSGNGMGLTSRETLLALADWLYLQTHGHPFFLVEILKGLLAREIILPSLREDGTWGLLLKRELLAQTPTADLIPASVRELIHSQIAQLTTVAWALLVAAAVLRKGLTFERLCQVAQMNELVGLSALEELLHSGLLCEGHLTESEQTYDEYSFPGEVIREVAYQEAGPTRQRLVQRRAWTIMQQEVRNDQSEEATCTLPVPIDGYPAVEAGSDRRRVAAGAGGRGMRGRRWTTAYESSAYARGHTDSGVGEKSLLAAWERGVAGQATSTVPRSPPGSPANDFFETR